MGFDKFHHARAVLLGPNRIDIDIVELVARNHLGGIAELGKTFVDGDIGKRQDQHGVRHPNNDVVGVDVGEVKFTGH